MPDFKIARRNMVDCQIHPFGVISPSILESFLSTPREKFVPEELKTVAYQSHTLVFPNSQEMILDPPVHAKMIQSLEVNSQSYVLDIGCALGYSSAILSPLVSTVIGLERSGEMVQKATTLWQELQVCNVAGYEGPLEKGCPAHAPFDAIIINGAVAKVPEALLKQLSDNGRLIAVVKPERQTMGQATLFSRSGNGGFSSVALFDASAPYLLGFEPEVEFQF